MRALPPRAVRSVAAVSLVLSALVTPVYADNLNKKVQDASEALTEASKAVVAARKTLEETKAKLPKAQAALASAQTKRAQADATHAAAVAVAQTAKKKYAAALVKVTSQQARIDGLQKKVDQFARSVYQQGPTSQWEIVLQSESPSDLTSRLETIKSVSQTTQNSLGDLESAKVDMVQIANQAQADKNEADKAEVEAADALAQAKAAAAEAAAAKAEVDRLISKQKDALAVAEKDRAEVKKKYDELRAEQIRANQQSASGSRGSGDPQATGPLSWPLPGYSSHSTTGWRVHPVYGYKSCHTGIDIPAPGGTVIHAADGGIVLATYWSTAYGRVTLIDHGDGLATMYAHQSAWLVSKGDVVGVGEAIGKVGTTGYSTGNHLHFEVHLNGVPYDPWGWFGGSKQVVSCWS